MREILHIIIVVLISAAAGGAVSLSISFTAGDSLLSGFLKGAGAGSIIGFAARYAFSEIYLKFRNRPLPAFLAMAGTVGIGTAAGCILMDIELIPTGLFVIAVSIIISIILTIVIFHYSVKLNKKLEQKQKEIETPFTDTD